MVEHSDRVIAVHDGREKGGKLEDLFYALISEGTAGNTDRAKLGQKQDKTGDKKRRYRLLYGIINNQSTFMKTGNHSLKGAIA